VHLALRKAPVASPCERGMKLRATQGGRDFLISLQLLSSAERLTQLLVCELARPMRFVLQAQAFHPFGTECYK
jgi:hypothetical protein